MNNVAIEVLNIDSIDGKRLEGPEVDLLVMNKPFLLQLQIDDLPIFDGFQFLTIDRVDGKI